MSDERRPNKIFLTVLVRSVGQQSGTKLAESQQVLTGSKYLLTEYRVKP
jgi:hypothetical protein